MPTIMLVLDGMENNLYKYCSSLKNYQPTGFRNNTPIGREADSLSCIMSLLGVPQAKIPDGRSVLEAYAAELPVEDDDLIFRGNMIDIDKHGVIKSSTLSNRKTYDIESREFLLKYLSGYKYLINIKNGKRFYKSIKTFPPHQNIGARVSEIMPQGDKHITEILNWLIKEKNIYAWSPSIKQEVPSFESIHGYCGAVVAQTEIVVGIAKAMEMYCPKLEFATADIDTDPHEKAQKALELSRSYDFVMLHINGIDECSHRKNKLQKLNFITKVDEQVIDYILKNKPNNTDFFITADHETSYMTGMHINGQTCYYSIKSNSAG